MLGVVGPSGVGKDSVIAGLLTARPAIQLIERCVTRTADPAREAHASLSEAEFVAREVAGQFALTWRAHGLAYGVPFPKIPAESVALVNLSRTVLNQADRVFPRFGVLAVQARPEVIAERLAAREGRPAGALLERLSRKVAVDFDPARLAIIDNSGVLGAAIAQAVDLIDTLLTPANSAGKRKPPSAS